MMALCSGRISERTRFVATSRHRWRSVSSLMLTSSGNSIRGISWLAGLDSRRSIAVLFLVFSHVLDRESFLGLYASQESFPVFCSLQLCTFLFSATNTWEVIPMEMGPRKDSRSSTVGGESHRKLRDRTRIRQTSGLHPNSS